MSIERFTQRMLNAANELGIRIEAEQLNKLLNYLQQLQRWNKTYNLTAVREPEQMLTQHLFDSLAVIAPLQQLLHDTNTSQPRILDVGSGGGLPGVVLAIINPTWQVNCVDAVDKKMAFVRQMAAVLQLPNLSAHHTRIETADSFDADLIISRAFASLVDFVQLSEKHLSTTGQIVAMKAKHPTDEITELEANTAWRVDDIKSLVVPELHAERCLVYLKRS